MKSPIMSRSSGALPLPFNAVRWIVALALAVAMTVGGTSIVKP